MPERWRRASWARGAALWVAAALAIAGCAGPAPAATYYVDAARGSDLKSGRSPADAWAHAPGDPEARGGPAGIVLRPGDTVRFRGDVAYRGSITMKFSGTADAPITYSGTGFGDGRALIDGADPVASAVPCPSAEACGGAPNWRALLLVGFPPPPGGTTDLFDDSGQLFEARYPALSDPFWSDDIAAYLATPLGAREAIEGGRLQSADLAARARDGGPAMRLGFWVAGNQVRYRRVLGVEGDQILFEPAGLRIYNNRDGRVSLVGSVKLLDRPGLYVLLGDGRAAVYPRAGNARLYLSSGRPGFDMHGQSHLVIEGFHFARGAGSFSRPTDGIAIRNAGGRARDWVIRDNRFGPAALHNGRGIISLARVERVEVRANRFADIQEGSGLRAGGDVADLALVDNRIARVGRTGLYLGGVDGARVAGNIIHDIRGIHGNGMSFYLANRNIRVEGNCVYASDRPITFKGAGNRASAPNGIEIRSNILIGNRGRNFAMTSWGAATRGVTISGNVLFGGKGGLRLHASDRDVTVRGNRFNRILVVGDTPPDWSIDGNQEQARPPEGMILTPDQCVLPGDPGPIRIGTR